ncbi:MAG: alpha/beta hydrolase [Alphaproteobacteria bacterium]
MPSGTKLDGPVHLPASGSRPDRVVVLLHGYGADGNDLIGMAPPLSRWLPTAAFHAPSGSESCEVWSEGRQWFSMQAHDPYELRRNPDRIREAHQAMLAGAREAAPALDHYLDDLLRLYGLTASRMALVGFSQGTMMALHVAFRRPDAMAAVVGFSGALLGAGILGEEILVRPPVLLIHGQEDPVVPVASLSLAESGLRTAGVEVSTRVRPGLEHGIDPDGLRQGARFLAEKFGGNGWRE